MKNPLIGDNLSDPIGENEKGQKVYELDCYNIKICKSYGEISFACLAGAYTNTRCSLGEKMQIRILNDANVYASYKPKKPEPPTEED